MDELFWLLNGPNKNIFDTWLVINIAVRMYIDQERLWGKVACFYILFVAATPMVYYFSVQQRCYSWCVFGVTLCFVMGLRMMNKASVSICILFAIAFLFSAYDYIYALIAVAGIAGFVNLY